MSNGDEFKARLSAELHEDYTEKNGIYRLIEDTAKSLFPKGGVDYYNYIYSALSLYAVNELGCRMGDDKEGNNCFLPQKLIVPNSFESTEVQEVPKVPER